MVLASKIKSGICAWLCVMVVMLGLEENRAWGFFAPPQPAPSVFGSATQEPIRDFYDASQYDASDYAVAAKNIAKIDVAALDFSSGANKAVFYSGPGNHARAMSFAERAGATPIDLTQGGQYLNSLKLYETMPAAQADAIWAQASQAYASGAQGRINLFVNGARPDRVFHTIEAPIIKANSNIYKQTFHY
jgi:hypothetical protein